MTKIREIAPVVPCPHGLDEAPSAQPCDRCGKPCGSLGRSQELPRCGTVRLCGGCDEKLRVVLRSFLTDDFEPFWCSGCKTHRMEMDASGHCPDCGSELREVT